MRYFRTPLLLLALSLTVALPLRVRAEATYQIGGGGHYWSAVDDIDIDDVDEDGFGWYLTLRSSPTPLTHIEFELEWLPDELFGVDEQILSPQAYLLVGSVIYAGVGVGTYYVDGDWAEDPFYAFRVGLDLEIIPRLHLDIHGNYRFDSWDDIDDTVDRIDSDTTTLGIGLRMEI